MNSGEGSPFLNSRRGRRRARNPWDPPESDEDEELQDPDNSSGFGSDMDPDAELLNLGTNC